MPDVLKLGSSPHTGIVNAAVAPCRYGVVLVAATDEGICDIHLGAHPDELADGYRQSAASTVEWVDGNEQPGWLAAVLNLVDDPTYALDYPLEVKGTPFQRLVWQALCDVPVGQTVTYGALAKSIGRPTAYRAVGAACGANRLALAIPCHRALRKGSGSLDYRWGTTVKQQILVAETAWILDSV